MALKLSMVKLAEHINVRFWSAKEITDGSIPIYAEPGWLHFKRVQLTKHVHAFVYVNIDSWLHGKLLDVDVKFGKKGYIIIIHFDDESMETEFVLKCL